MIGKMVSDNGYINAKVAQEPLVNFASTQNIARFARHAAIVTHPLQIMRIVSMSLEFAGIPRPKTLALGAKHLVAALGLMNKNLAIGTRFSVLLQQGNRSDSVLIANMVISLKFPAMSTRMFVASGTFPSGGDKAIAFGISTAMDELLNSGGIIVIKTIVYDAMPGQIQVILEFLELSNLSVIVLLECFVFFDFE